MHARRARSAVLASLAAIALASLGPAAAAWAAPGPVLSASTTSIGFGTLAVGQVSGTQKVTFTNTGDADLHLTQASWPSAPFDVLSTDCAAPLAPGGSCFADVTFAPTVAGAFSGMLTINSDGGKAEIALSGSTPGAPAEPKLAVGSGTDFGSVTVGQSSAPFTVTVTNDGDAAVTDLVVGASSSAVFSRSTTCGATLAPGASCTVTSAFTPVAAGGALGQIDVTAYGNQWAIGFVGMGVAGPVIDPADPPQAGSQQADPTASSLATTGDSALPPIVLGIALLVAGGAALVVRRARVTRPSRDA